VKNAVLFLVLTVTAATASGLRVAGSDLLLPVPFEQMANGNGRTATGVLEDTVVIAYDDGTHRTWWCSDRDSFGAAVRFTPAEYPCQIVGARAEVGCDTTFGGRQVYLRVFDDDGSGGLPGTVLREEHRPDVPKNQVVGFRDYDLATPVVVDSGDFYLCFWQKHYFNMYFGTDTHFDSTPREWWYFPDLKWVTPMGPDAADHLIRARVLYGTGVEEELTSGGCRVTNGPTIVRGVLFLQNGDCTGARSTRASVGLSPFCVLLDDAGRKVLDLSSGANDVSRLSPGVYFVRGRLAVDGEPSGVTKVLVTR